MIDFFEQITTAQIVFFAILFVSFLVQQIYHWRIFGRVAFYKNKKQSTAQPGVSVIICASNEDENLRHNLPVLLTQNYPQFEVIVVLDNCTDNSDIVVGALKREYKNLEVRTINRRQDCDNYKKIDLILGIRAAKYDTLLFTDADCCPTDANWISEMQSNFCDKTKVVLGYTRYENIQNFVRCDLFFSSLHYLGMAACGRAYMGEGQNCAYSKQLYFDACGFNSAITFHREDVIAINKISNKKNTKIDVAPSAIMNSTRRIATYNWYFERRRLAKTFKFAGSKNKYPATLEMISRVAFFTFTIVVALQSLIFLCAAIFLFLLRFASVAIVFSHAQKRLCEKNILLPMLCYDLFSSVVFAYYKFGSRPK